MAKYMSEDYFAQVQAALAQDQKWLDSTKSFKTTVAFSVTDTKESYLLNVENGNSTFQKAAIGAPAEFSFEGTYDTWCKVAKGDVDIQSAVLKGHLKFKGSLTKILMSRDRFMRVAEIMREVPKEF
jgi:putative sterol carrier protein